jgi:hypothetical protein
VVNPPAPDGRGGPMLAAKHQSLGKLRLLQASRIPNQTQVALLPAGDWSAPPRPACSCGLSWIDSVSGRSTLLGHAQVLGHSRPAETLLVIVATARLVLQRHRVSLQLQGGSLPFVLLALLLRYFDAFREFEGVAERQHLLGLRQKFGDRLRWW